MSHIFKDVSLLPLSPIFYALFIQIILLLNSQCILPLFVFINLEFVLSYSYVYISSSAHHIDGPSFKYIHTSSVYWFPSMYNIKIIWVSLQLDPTIQTTCMPRVPKRGRNREGIAMGPSLMGVAVFSPSLSLSPSGHHTYPVAN